MKVDYQHHQWPIDLRVTNWANVNKAGRKERLPPRIPGTKTADRRKVSQPARQTKDALRHASRIQPALCHFLTPKSFLNALFPPYFFFYALPSLLPPRLSCTFFPLALCSPLLFMVKSLLDPDEIKRRVLMFIGWKKVHIVPERREFN